MLYLWTEYQPLRSMSTAPDQKAILLLDDGTTYTGRAVGKIGTTSGEICFNTGMTGYQEVFTDPSYYGQILITTNAHIGNYGAADADQESSQIQIAGLICKNWTPTYSRPSADGDVQTYFEENGIVGISDVDTRSLVRHIRSKGAMNCIISSEDLSADALKARLLATPSMDGLELASSVSTTEPYTLGDDTSAIRIAVLDFGTKRNIIRCLAERGAYVKVYPARTSYHEMLAFKPDGFFLSNGPGDPSSMDYAVDTVRQILDHAHPLFGICLGHQLLALACDLPTYKMHHGHRGINHPVKNLITAQCEITSQNHGFGVDPDPVYAASETVEVTHINLNDDTIEGIRLRHKPAFSVQYHPESNPGPHDSRYLFDDFIALIKEQKQVI